MSEKLKNLEVKSESLDIGQEVQKNLEKIQKLAENQEKHKPRVEALEHKAKHAAKEKSSYKLEAEVSDQTLHYGSQKELKDKSYYRTLHRIRSHLNTAEQSFSLFVHRPAIEKTSNAVASTVARPYPLIMAGTITIMASFGLLYVAKKYGFEYNFSIVIIAFALGYIVGTMFEFAIKRILRKRYAKNS